MRTAAPVNDKQSVPEGCLATCKWLGIVPTKYILSINVAEQSVSLFVDGKFVRKMSVSTSSTGVGQIEGSNCTPLGLHRIAEKIGGGEPAGTVFRSRQPVGHISDPEFADAKITTRILWLEGLELGFNKGGNVDTHARYLYIHGVADQKTIGKTASNGSIFMGDDDLIQLFDQLASGTLVWIAEK